MQTSTGVEHFQTGYLAVFTVHDDHRLNARWRVARDAVAAGHQRLIRQENVGSVDLRVVADSHAGKRSFWR